MRPTLHFPMFLPRLDVLLEDVPWVKVRDARQECFMAMTPTTYNYGTPPHDQTYTSVPYHEAVGNIQDFLNMLDYAGGVEEPQAQYNVCFLNRYDDEHNQLGSDDSPGMLHEHLIAVVSFGEPREIWVREKGFKGEIPKEDRYNLADGSLFIMPPGFQLTHQYRIPKGSRKMGPRVSLTFRRYVP